MDTLIDTNPVKPKTLAEIRDELLKSKEFKDSQGSYYAYANGIIDMYNEIFKLKVNEL
jgi:hypothetical protein